MKNLYASSRISRILLFLVFLLASNFKSWAQPLQINVTAIPPYSVHLQDYVNSADNILLTITNTSQSEHNFKLIPTMTGDNGVSITIQPSYLPSSPINIQPFQTISLSFSQLKQYNNNITENDIDLVGYSNAQLIQTEALPEGNYTLCVKAFEYFGASANQLSNDFGCATFPITHFDPPVIITPQDATNVPPTQPQMVNFTWTPSGSPGITRYLFEIIDMTQNNLANANDAFQNQAVQKYVVQDIITTQLFYDLAYPPLIENHTYAIRVTAYDPDQNLSYKNLGRSPVSTFTYKPFVLIAEPVVDVIDEIVAPDNNEELQGVSVDINNNDWLVLSPPPNDDDNQPVEDPDDTPGCIGNCSVPIPYPNNGNVTVEANDEVVVGKFKMKVVSTNGNNSGQGNIFVNWLKAPIKVQFNNISVNNDMQMYSGEVFAVIDGGGITESIAKNENADLSQIQNQLGSIQNLIQEAGRRVSNYAPDNQIPIGLPIALDNDEFDLAIVGLVFKHDIAYMNAVLPVQIPEAINGEYLSIHTSGVCIRPNGLGAAGKIILNNDVSVDLSNFVELKFNKTNTYVDFNCSGITKARIDGELIFERDLLLPVSNNGDVTNGKVKASFAVDLEDNHNWMAENVTLSPSKFTTPATRGFIFTGQNLKYDHSDLDNPDNIDFPNNYPLTNNTWKGLYIQNIGCQLPDGFQQGNDPLSVNAQHLFIDKFGFTGNITAQNLINFNSGKLDGWKFSIDAFGLDILNSGLETGSFAGKLRIPISETALDYDVTISAPENENSSVDFEFILEDLPDLSVDMWMAQLNLENSTVSLTKQGNSFKVGAILNGGISIGWGSNDNVDASSVSSFNLPTVEFSNLEIGGGNIPSISNGSFGLVNNVQATCATFPINLSEINFQFNGPQVGINFQQLGFTLANMQNGLSGHADFTVFGKWNQQAGFYKYEKTQLGGIYVDADLVAAHVVGFINIYNEHPTFGNGFRGGIKATVKMTNTAIDITLQAGKTLGNNSFRYFYFDGLVDLGDNLGIPLGATGVALYGFGGGMWYNMNRSSQFDSENPIMVDEFDGNGYSDEVGTTESGVTFTPQQGKVGFNASVLFGIYQARNVFNGDLEFGMQLDVNDLSLDLVYMSGNGYVMQSPTGDRSPDNSLIAASVDIEIDPNKPMFHCAAGINVSLGGIVKAGATINMHYENLGGGEKLWYFKVGEWDENSTYAQDYPWEDEKRFHVGIDLVIVEATFHGYFMTGNALPGLPPLPKVIRDNLGIIEDDRDPLLGNTPAAGIAMGAGLHVDVGFEFLIFYADVEFAFGADVLIKDFGNIDCGDYDPVGINGWYAKGQAYGYFKGEAGLYVDLWFFEGKAKLLNLEATTALFAQGPNPMYVKGMVAIEGEIFNGLIKVNTNFKLEAGEKCDLPEYNPFDDIPIVSEVKPSDGEKEVKTSSDVHVAFNFPRTTFTIEEYDEEGDVTIRSFKYEIKKWELKHGNKVLPWQTHSYTSDGYSRKSIQKDYMPGEANIKYYMLVKGYETTNGGKVEKASQTYEGTFKTGPRPDYIEPSNVKAMQPLGGKRFVLQEEYNKGYLQLKKGQGYLFTPGSPGNGLKQYKARFKVLKTNQVSAETNVTWNGGSNRVEFGMPNNLANEKIYGINVIRLFTPPINDFAIATNTIDKYKNHYLTGGPGGNGINGNGPNQILNNVNQGNNNNNNINQINNIQAINLNQVNSGNQQMILNANLINQQGNGGNGMANNLPLAQNAPPPPPPANWNINNGFATPGDGDNQPKVKIELLNRELIGTSKTEKVEFNLYTYYWRTSRFNNWEDKLKNAEIASGAEGHEIASEWKGSNVTTVSQVNILYLVLPENIDRYDAYGFKYSIGDNDFKINPSIILENTASSDIWLEHMWSNGDIKPWKAPELEDWGNPIYLQDEYNEPIAYDLDQFPDFDAYWPDPLYDWTTDRFKDMLKGNGIFDDRDFPVPQSYKGWVEHPPMEIYKTTRHGIFQLQGNPTLPAGNLTTNEVQASINQAPQPQNQPPPSQTLAFNLGNNGMQGMAMGMSFESNPVNARIPIVEYQDWVAAHDYTWLKEFVINGITDELESIPQNSGNYWPFKHTVYDPIYFWIQSDEIWPPSRESGFNWFQLNGKELHYDTNQIY